MPRIGIITTTESGVDLVVEWKIENFFNLPETDGADYYSPDFSFGGETWYMNICPNGWSGNDSSGHVNLVLCKYISARSIKQSFSLSLKTAKGEKYNERRCSKDFDDDNDFHDFNRFIPRSELRRRRSELVPEGYLTIICTMKSSTSAGSATGKENKENSESTGVNASTQTEEKDSEACASGSSASPCEKKVAHDFKELFHQKEDCDVVIKVKGSEIPAHRLVLKVRSPVFTCTFRHDMKESATGVVEIEDCDPSPFWDFLYFLYCGDIEMISRENVFSLFTLADKYEVMDLKAKCLDFMKKNMAIDTFCETITLALQHSEIELITLATDFFVENAEEILETVKWQTFAAENPTQSNELFIKFVKSVKRSST